MKKMRFLGIAVCLMIMLSSGMSAFAAGYDVVMEPTIERVDGTINKVVGYDSYVDQTYFECTPFNKGFAVVHSNTVLVPGFEVEYYDKTSRVVDAYGNTVYDGTGTYDCIGVYPFSPEYRAPYEGYDHMKFNPSEGVDYLGYITVNKGDKFGMIDVYGNVIVPCEYTQDEFYDARTAYGVTYEYRKNNEYTGKYKIRNYNMDRDRICYSGLAVVASPYEENCVGIVDENDNIVVPFQYTAITPCYDEICWVLKDGKWGTIKVNNDKVTVKVDEEEVLFDQIPLIINGRTLAPLRAIFEKLGATVEWNEETETITATKGETVINMTINKKEMYKNGQMIWLDEAPQIVGERTLVPVRAIAESFNCGVEWDEETQTVTIKQ